jgi:hypothetical protein
MNKSPAQRHYRVRGGTSWHDPRKAHNPQVDGVVTYQPSVSRVAVASASPRIPM